MALNRQGINRALDQWRTYVGSNYQAKVDAANAARFARLVGLTKEPFNIAANTVLALDVQGAIRTAALTAGAAQTAAAVAADITAAAIDVSAIGDLQTRLQITNDTAPTGITPSTLKVGQPGGGAVNPAAQLGFGIGQEDYREVMQNPGPGGFVITDQFELPVPLVWVRRVTVAQRGVSREDKDSFTLEVVVRADSPSGSKKAATELCQHHIDAIDEIMHDDPSAENCFTYSVVERTIHTPHVMGLRRRDLKTGESQEYILAEAVLAVRIDVRNWRN